MREYWRLLLLSCIMLAPCPAGAQAFREIRGKVLDEKNKPVSFATVRVTPTDITVQSSIDGSFILQLPAYLAEFTLTVSHIGKAPAVRTIRAAQFSELLTVILPDQSLKLREVEVNGIRTATTASNSSIVFDREAIEQTQPLSIANVLNYLPGQTILKPTVSVQGIQGINLRSATGAATLSAAGSAQASGVMETQNLNERFGLTIIVDGAPVSNNANLQGSTSFMGMFSANNITNPDAIVPDRSQRNGTLYSNYGGNDGLLANTGIDLRMLPAENVERIEVISGVASARYGDYTTGVINIDRQAGISPLRISLQHTGGSVSSGISRGLKLGAKGGNLNISLDYLHSNDDPRDKLKQYERIGGGLIWTWQQRGGGLPFKNTLSLDYRTTLDQTRLDPDEGNQRMARFNNRSFNISNRSNWTLKKRWLYDIELRASYGTTTNESYDQWYLNSTSLIKIAEATETSTYEGRYGPGYYLAFHHIKGRPVNTSLRLETNSIFRLAKSSTYKLTWGIEYRYSANKGPGVLNDPAKPRFDDQGYKNDRPSPFDAVPAISNQGVYLENVFITRLLKRNFKVNAGVRGDWQNSFFTAAPRLNASWSVLKNLSFNIAYGIATKAPGLSQLNPGNVYFDIPLLELYSNTNPEHQLYLVHTEVIKQEKLQLKPYSSYTFETGFSWNGRLLKGSVYYTNRIMRNGFATNTTLVPVTVDNYAYDPPVAGQKIKYYKDGTQETYYLTYNGMRNGMYSRSNSIELILRTATIKPLRTSFDINTTLYSTYYKNKSDAPDLGLSGQLVVDYTKEAVFGAFNPQDSRSLTIKSTILSNTHIPALRMTIGFTGEIFWVAKTTTLTRSVYPHGYYTIDGRLFYLSPEQALSPQYAHLIRRPMGENTDYRPATVYPNIHLRLAKEISDVLRISFNAFNVFNIRPVDKEGTSNFYFNGQPAYSAAMTFTIK